MCMHRVFAAALVASVMIVGGQRLTAAEGTNKTLSLADGKLTLAVPANWVQKEPKFKGIVLYEFAVPKEEGDAADGRVTMGAAGGNLAANQQRWLAQFIQPDGSKTSERAKQTERDIGGAKIHMLDVSGTYVAPSFSGGGKFPGYRMLAAVIETPKNGSWYVRLYGPEKTVTGQKAEFDKFIAGLKLAGG